MYSINTLKWPVISLLIYFLQVQFFKYTFAHWILLSALGSNHVSGIKKLLFFVSVLILHCPPKSAYFICIAHVLSAIVFAGLFNYELQILMWIWDFVFFWRLLLHLQQQVSVYCSVGQSIITYWFTAWTVGTSEQTERLMIPTNIYNSCIWLHVLSDWKDVTGSCCLMLLPAVLRDTSLVLLLRP